MCNPLEQEQEPEQEQDQEPSDSLNKCCLRHCILNNQVFSVWSGGRPKDRELRQDNKRRRLCVSQVIAGRTLVPLLAGRRLVPVFAGHRRVAT